MLSGVGFVGASSNTLRAMLLTGTVLSISSETMGDAVDKPTNNNNNNNDGKRSRAIFLFVLLQYLKSRELAVS